MLNVLHPPGKSKTLLECIPEFYPHVVTGRYDAFMVVAEKLLSKMTYDLLKLSLSTRTYSPTIEMYNQVC